MRFLFFIVSSTFCNIVTAQQSNHWVVQGYEENINNIVESYSTAIKKTVFYDIDFNYSKLKINKINSNRISYNYFNGNAAFDKLSLGYQSISNTKGELVAYTFNNILYSPTGDSLDYISQYGGHHGIQCFKGNDDSFTLYFIESKKQYSANNFECQFSKSGPNNETILDNDSFFLVESIYSNNKRISKHKIEGINLYGKITELSSNLTFFTDRFKEKKIQFVWNDFLYQINVSKSYDIKLKQIIHEKLQPRAYNIRADLEGVFSTPSTLVTSPNGRWTVFNWSYFDPYRSSIVLWSKLIVIDNENDLNWKVIFKDSSQNLISGYSVWDHAIFTKDETKFLVQQIKTVYINEEVKKSDVNIIEVSTENFNYSFFNVHFDSIKYQLSRNKNYLLKSLNDIVLAPNGKLFSFITYTYPNPKNKIEFIRCFEIAELIKKNGVFTIRNPVKVMEGIPFLGRVNPAGNFTNQIFFPTTPITYHKIDFTSKSICNDLTYKFTNNSDTSWFDHYKWYWGDGDSSYSDNKTQNVLHQFKKAGTYEVLLRAYNPEGGSVWYTDSVIILPEPIAKFGTKNTIGCQWIAVSFADSSLLQNKVHTWRWNFGDGTDTIIGSTNNIMPKNKSIKHTYTTSGKFNVQLQVSDGRCTDTFNAIQNISILPAPRPGIAIDKTTGCTPLEVQFGRIYSDLTDSTIYHFKPALVPNNHFSSAVNKTIMLQSGPFTLIQYLYGPSGCVTQDSVKLNITPGIPVSYLPELKRSTVINNRTTLTEWKPVPHAKNYQVYRNGLIHDVVNDTIFMDYLSSEIDQSYTYQIQAKDSCANFGGNKSNIGKTIYLNVKEIEPLIKSNFSTALLTWTPYEDWSLNGGVKGYECLGTYDMETSNWQPLTNLNDTHFNDKNFIQPKKFEKCFVVKARSGNQAFESQSNSYCLPYQATLFAPSAFTPNGDGLNDEFNIFNYGFDKFTLTIFNSWGQKLFEQNNSEGTWKPEKDVPQGVYIYYVKAYRKGVEYTFTNTVTLLK